MKADRDRSLMRACAKYIMGESTGVKIKGAPERIKAFQDVVTASKNLYEALCRSQVMGEIEPLIAAKRQAAENFKKTTGLTWRL
jgi:hypothetical protein